MEVPAREFKRVKRSVAPKMNKKKKKEKRSEEVRSRSKRVRDKCKKGWWVVGLGGAWHMGNQKSDLTPPPFFF